MIAGYFPRTYELWRLTETQNEYGTIEQTWNKLADLPGRAYPIRATDEVIAQKREGVITWTFATDAEASVKAGDEIRFDGRRLEVRTVSVTSTGRRLEVLCEETRT